MNRRLPHQSGLPHLPGVPHLRVNRPLVMMAIINLTKATLISVATSVADPSKSYLEVLDWFQVCALAFVPTSRSIFVFFEIFVNLCG